MEHEGSISRLDACTATSLGRIVVITRSWLEPIDVVASGEDHWLELARLPVPRSTRGCFPNRWGPHRFEPIGQMFLVPAGHRIHAKSDRHKQSSVACVLSQRSVQEWFDGELNWTDGRLRGSLNIVHPFIRMLLLRLGEEVLHPGLAGEAVIELVTAQIAIELARYYLGIEESKTVGRMAAWRIRLIDDRLAEGGKSPSLRELAALCQLSVRQLTRAFRASHGCSLGNYIANGRIDHAKRLLVSGKYVKTIAHELGYNSASNFYSMFRRATGETPDQFRQRRYGPASRR